MTGASDLLATNAWEARAALIESHRRLRDVKSQQRVVEVVSARLERQLRQNHFAERMLRAYDQIPTPH